MKKRRGPPWFRRYAAGQNECPKCGAKSEHPCTSPNGKARKSVHRVRIQQGDKMAYFSPIKND